MLFIDFLAMDDHFENDLLLFLAATQVFELELWKTTCGKRKKLSAGLIGDGGCDL